MPGYEAKFVHPLLKRHECPICLFAMRNPVQTECGHLFCKECLSPVLRRRRPICPLDQEAITQDGVSQLLLCTLQPCRTIINCNQQLYIWAIRKALVCVVYCVTQDEEESRAIQKTSQFGNMTGLSGQRQYNNTKLPFSLLDIANQLVVDIIQLVIMV